MRAKLGTKEGCVIKSNSCLIQSWISREVGCRHIWDPYADEAIPLCNSTEQFEKFQDYHDTIAMSSISKITDFTGCLQPCRYNRYEIFRKIDLKIENDGERSIELILATDHAMQQSEVLLYPLVSFVSEFGGALGLFIGFSFMMILDAFEMLLQMFYNFMKTTKDQNF